MCMEDIQIGRKLASICQTKAFALGGNATLIEADEYRVSLMFSIPSGNSAIVAPEGIDASAGGGFLVTPTIEPILFSIEDWGRLVRSRWTVSGLVGAGTITISQSSLMEK